MDARHHEAGVLPRGELMASTRRGPWGYRCRNQGGPRAGLDLQIEAELPQHATNARGVGMFGAQGDQLDPGAAVAAGCGDRPQSMK